MNNSKLNINAFICAALLFCLIPPYFFWHGIMAEVAKIMQILLGVFYLYYLKKLEGATFYLFLFFLLIILLGAYLSEKNLYFFISLLPLVFLPFAKEHFSYRVYQYFVDIYVVVISLSLLVYFIALLGYINPYTSIPPLNELKSYNYDVYPLLVKSSNDVLLRFCGPFDEPGVVGTLSGVLLCIEKLSIKKYKALVLLISGLVSLSFFFYVLVAVYLVVYGSAAKRNVSLVLLYLSIIGVTTYVVVSNERLYDVIASRFEWDDENKKISGENRISQDVVSYYFNEAIESGTIWFGLENKQLYYSRTEGSSSIFTIIFIYGLLFTIMYCLFFILYGFVNKKQTVSFCLYLFVFLGTIYQRPYIFKPIYIVLFVTLAMIDRVTALPDEKLKAKKSLVFKHNS